MIVNFPPNLLRAVIVGESIVVFYRVLYFFHNKIISLNQIYMIFFILYIQIIYSKNDSKLIIHYKFSIHKLFPILSSKVKSVCV